MEERRAGRLSPANILLKQQNELLTSGRLWPTYGTGNSCGRVTRQARMRPDWLQDDPLRKSILEEIHARPAESIDVPTRVRRVAAMLPRSPDAVRQEQVGFDAWCRDAGVDPPAENARQYSFDLSEFRVTWELHTEFVTLTWASHLADAENWPGGIGLELFEANGIATCIRVDLIDETTVPQRIVSGSSWQACACRKLMETRARLRRTSSRLGRLHSL